MAFDLSSAKPIGGDGYMAGEATNNADFEKQWAASMANAPQGTEIARTNSKIVAENNVPQPLQTVGFDLSTATPVTKKPTKIPLKTDKKLSQIEKMYAASKGNPNVKLKDIGRQFGLAGRYLAEGTADTAGIFTDPITGLVNRGLGTNINSLRGATSNTLDSLGFPQPQNARERVVGDASRMLSSTGAFIGGAGALKPFLSETGKSVATQMMARPDLQAGSALGAGYAGGEAREAGASPTVQTLAALAGGLAMPLTTSAIESGINAVKNRVIQPQQIDNAIAQAGIDTQTIPTPTLNTLIADVEQALKSGQPVSPDAVRRLADYKAVGATPLRGNLTLNPVDITRDKNLTKIAANSDDLVANQLPMIANRNNSTLISNLNDMGANSSDAYTAGNTVINALNKRNDAAKSVIGSYYDKARSTQGRSAALDPSAFTKQANDALDQSLLGGKLPSDVRNLLNKTAKGEMPLTVDTAEQFKTRIGDLQRASTDPAERMALGKVREALDNTPLLEGQGQGAINAFNKARSVNRAYMQIVEKTPALQAVRDGIEPDKFVQKFIIGSGEKSNMMDVAMLKSNIKKSPEAIKAVRGQILNHLKSKGVNGAADEVANFSPAGYNNALTQIGERKLNLFFEPKEIEQLKRIGRVASYENFQPKGSAVNNSNTAAALFTSVIDKIDKYVPLGSVTVGKPVKNMMANASARNSLDASKSLINQSLQPKQRMPIPLFPLLAGSGLLSTEQ